MLRGNRIVFREPHPTKKVGSSSLADYQLHRKTRFPEQLLPRRQAPCPCPAVEFLGDRLKPFLKQSRGLPFLVSSKRQLVEFSDIAIPANHVAERFARTRRRRLSNMGGSRRQPSFSRWVNMDNAISATIPSRPSARTPWIDGLMPVLVSHR